MATIWLTTQDFKDKVFNYTQEQEWKYRGYLMTEPVLEELATTYKEKLIIYKVDTEKVET